MDKKGELKILAVDDAQENLELVSLLVEEFFPEATFLAVREGAKGLRAAQEQLPDLILLDAIMPGMDGFEVCRQLKADPATQPIPVLMVSGVMVESGDRVSGLEVGADGYICKPYEVAELVAQIKALLRLKRGEEQLRRHKEQLEYELEARAGDLRNSEAKLRSLFEHSPDAIVVEDMDGYILDVNPAAGALYRRTQEDLVGRHFLELVPKHAAAEAEKRKLQLLVETGASVESSGLTKDGESIPIEIRASRIRLENADAMLLHLRDISERKTAEAREQELQGQLVRAQRMESLGILAGGVAHDLNNILGPLVAYPELLLERLPPESLLRQDVEQIGVSAMRAVAIIQDLLALARRGTYQTVPLDLNDVVAEYEHSAGFQEQRDLHTSINVVTRLEPELPLVNGSAPHLMQVVMNLVLNAFEAMPHHGRLTIATTHEHVPPLNGAYEKIPGGNYAVLRVADKGFGITAEDLEHIFEPFYTKKKMGRSGSGLGLPVVYGVVKDLNGYIDVKTAVGRGSEFIIYFPAASNQVRPPSERPVASLEGNETILVVDDVKEQREVASALLSSLGYRVSAVANGREAAEYLMKQKVDLVVLDMILEDTFDGLDTFGKIKEIRRDQRCVIVSGFSETNRVRKALSMGAGSYIRKPYTREILAQAVRVELDRPERFVA